MIIDCDQHLYESRTLWRDHIDPAHRDDALAIEDDELGYAWVTWRGGPLEMADVQLPKGTEALGEHRNRRRRGERSEYSYDDALPADYWEPAARRIGSTRARSRRGVPVPQLRPVVERRLSGSLPALTANMTAWNRWCADCARRRWGASQPGGAPDSA